MIIELVGLPGAGKTTFAHRLEQAEGWKRIRPSGAVELLLYNALFLLRHPRCGVRQVLWLMRYRGARELWYTKFVNLFLVHNAKYQKAQFFELAIIDQGHLQNAFSLFENDIGAEELAEYIRILPKTDCSVIFDISPEISQKRMSERGHGVRKEMDKESRTDWLRSLAERISVVRDSLVHEGVDVFSIHRDDDVESLLNRLSAPVAVYYIHPSRMPTEKAHGGQIARMVSEWGELGARVTVVAGFRDENCAGGDIAKYYGVRKIFFTRFVSLNSLHRRLPGSPRLAFFLNNLIVFFRLLFLRPESRAVIFTRRPEVAWLFSLRGYRVVYECHEWFAHWSRLAFFLATCADIIVVINRYTGEEFLKRGFPKQRLVTETNGVYYDAFDIAESKEQARAKLQLPAEWRIYLYAGGLKMMGEEKGVLIILKALAQLGDPLARFIAVGGKTSEIKEYQEEAKKLGVLSQCVFVERQTREELALYQRSADALMITHPRTHLFEYYMAPLKTFEYMASGQPIIATDLLSLREVLDEESAFWFTPDDVGDLVRAMHEVVQSSDESMRRGKNAQKKAKEHTWHARAQRLYQRFAGLISQETQSTH